MANKTFPGGVHPKGWKDLAKDVPLRVHQAKGDMVYVLGQHIGAPSKPIVAKGDEVLVGQRIAEAASFVSANIACSCSGTVKAIEKRRNVAGAMVDCIVVENDGEYRTVPGFRTETDPDTVSNDEILERVKDAGIIGLGGAGFPTHVKLAPKDPEGIRYLIANGVECEPYLTCNDQLMRRESDEIVEGLELMLRLFPNAEAVICIEDNKPEAIAAMTRAAKGKSHISVLPLQTKYPQGGERSLIKVVTGIDFPTAMLPAEVGCLVSNVGTVYAIRNAVRFNEPLISHVLTVTGDCVKEPCNLIVREGTSFTEVLEAAGGLRDDVTPKKMFVGGPMMGIAMSSLDVPVQKNNNGLVITSEDENEKAEAIATNCLHCGRCQAVCPLGLTPQLMAEAAEVGDFERYEKKLYGLECINCGSCTFICPARRPLTQRFKQAKAEIMAIRAMEREKARKEAEA